MDFRFETYHEAVPGYPGYEAMVWAKTHSVCVVAMPKFLAALRDYFLKGPLLEPLRESRVDTVIAHKYSDLTVKVGDMVATAATHAPQQSKPFRVKMDVTLVSPDFVIPYRKGNFEAIVLELKPFQLKTTDLQYNFLVQFGLSASKSMSSLASGGSGSFEEEPPQDLKALDHPPLPLEKLEGLLNSERTDVPQTKVEMKFHELTLQVSRLNEQTQMERPTARMTIAGIAASVAIFPGNTMRIGASVTKISFVDSRPASTSVYREFLTGGDVDEPMLSLQYLRENETGDQAARVVLSKPRLMLAPSIALDLKDIFAKPFEAMAKKPVPPAVSEDSQKPPEPEEREVVTLEKVIEDGLVARMLHPAEGVQTKNKGGILSKTQQCFSGLDLVDWLLDNEALAEKRDQAVTIGSVLLERGFIAPMEKVKTTGFRDEQDVLYVFTALCSQATDAKSRTSSESDRSMSSESDTVMSPASAIRSTTDTVKRKRAATFATVDIASVVIAAVDDETRYDSLCINLAGSFAMRYEQDCVSKDTANVMVKRVEAELFQMEDGQRSNSLRHYYILSPMSCTVNYSMFPREELVDIALRPIELNLTYQNFKMIMGITAKLQGLGAPADDSAQVGAAQANEVDDKNEHRLDKELILMSPFSFKTWHGGYLVAKSNGTIEVSKHLHETAMFWAEPYAKVRGAICLRTSHGKYVCAEPNGKLLADRTHAQLWESFIPERVPGGTISLLSFHGKYVSVDKKLHATAHRPHSNDWEHFQVTPMTARSGNGSGKRLAEKTQRLSFKCDSVSLTLANDYKGRNIPLLEARLRGLEAEVLGWSQETMSARAGLAMEAEFYNDAVMCHEPLIEYWEARAEMTSVRRTQHTELTVSADAPLNVNVTHAFIDSLARTYASLSEDYYRTMERLRKARAAPGTEVAQRPDSGKQREADKGEYHTSWIVNKTGTDAQCRIQELTDSDMWESEKFLIPKDTPQPLEQSRSKAKTARDLQALRRQARIVFFNGVGIEKVTVDRIGCNLHLAPNGPPVVTEVTWNDDGSKLVTLRSHVVVANSTTLPLQAVLRTGSGTVGGPGGREAVLTLAPGQSEPVPLDFIGDSELFVSLDGSGARPQHVVGVRALATVRDPVPVVCECSVGPQQVFLIARLEVDRDSFVKVSPDAYQARITFYPPLTVRNLLPVPVWASVASSRVPPVEVKSGASVPTYVADTRHEVTVVLGRIPGFSDLTYKLSATKDRLRDSTSMEDAAKRKMDVLVDSRSSPFREVTFYPQFFIVNKTKLGLFYQHGGAKQDALAPGMQGKCVWGMEPFAFSCSKLAVRSDDTNKWSESFCIDAVGTSGTFEFPSADNRTALCVRCSVSLHPDTKYDKVKLVTLAPQYVLVNGSSLRVFVRQDGCTDAPLALDPGVQVPFHWRIVPGVRERLLALTVTRTDGSHMRWSGPLHIDQLGEQVVKVRAEDPAKAADYYLRVDVSDSRETTFVVLKSEDPASPPFVVENDTPLAVVASQAGARQASRTEVAPSARAVFGWDEPCGAQQIVLECPSWGSRQFKACKIEPLGSIAVPGSAIVFVYIKAEGPTRVVALTNNRAKYLRESQSSKAASSILAELENRVQLKVALRLPGIGVSVVTRAPAELAFVSLRGIEVAYSRTRKEEHVEVKVAGVQLDDQSLAAEFPVVLRETIRDTPKPWLHMSAVKSTQYSASILYFSYFSVLMQELDLCVDDVFLNALSDFYASLPVAAFTSAAAAAQAAARRRSAYEGYWGVPACLDSSAAASRMAYFRLLHLNPIKVSLSFVFQGATSSAAAALRPRNAVTSLLETLGATVANVDRTPLCFNALLLEHPFCSVDALMGVIATHYMRQGVLEVYKVIGSTELLGNPVGLFANISTGVMDFFYEPAQGIVTSPEAFGKGLARGTSSLVKNSVYGLFNTVSKITGALGKGVATLTFDDEYVQQRRINQRKQARHVGEGALEGAKSLGMGFFHGITGVVTKPVEGAQKEGALGFAKGLGRGVIGIAVKPVTGVLDFASKTTEGIRNTTTVFDKENAKVRVRKVPRLFGQNNELLEYKESDSEGAFIIAQNPKELRGHSYKWHTVVDDGRVLMLTDRALLVFSKSKKLENVAMFRDISRVDLVKGGMTVSMKRPGATPVVVQCSDDAEAMRMYQKTCGHVKGYADTLNPQSSQ
eukprot:m51a1_g8475 hypothetical protein (2175) ;mRNA; r:495382-503027